MLILYSKTDKQVNILTFSKRKYFIPQLNAV